MKKKNSKTDRRGAVGFAGLSWSDGRDDDDDGVTSDWVVTCKYLSLRLVPLNNFDE